MRRTRSDTADEASADWATTAVQRLHETSRQVHLAREMLNGGSGHGKRVDVHLATALDTLDRAVQDVQRLALSQLRVAEPAAQEGPPPRHRASPREPAG